MDVTRLGLQKASDARDNVWFGPDVIFVIFDKKNLNARIDNIVTLASLKAFVATIEHHCMVIEFILLDDVDGNQLLCG